MCGLSGFIYMQFAVDCTRGVVGAGRGAFKARFVQRRGEVREVDEVDKDICSGLTADQAELLAGENVKSTKPEKMSYGLQTFFTQTKQQLRSGSADVVGLPYEERMGCCFLSPKHWLPQKIAYRQLDRETSDLICRGKCNNNIITLETVLL